MVSGAFQMKRYFRSAGAPFELSGHTSTSRPRRRFSSYRTTMPPTLPDPEALDQTMFASTGSGVAQPLSPPPTVCHIDRGMMPPRPPPPRPPPSSSRLLLGPRYDGPSCLLPYTKYGTWLSTVTWYICAIGSRTRFHVRPRLMEIEMPASFATAIRFALPGSIHMSWLS